MGSKVAGAAADQAKKFGDHAKRTAQSEINSSVTRIINDTIREIGKKIFGK